LRNSTLIFEIVDATRQLIFRISVEQITLYAVIIHFAIVEVEEVALRLQMEDTWCASDVAAQLLTLCFIKPCDLKHCCTVTNMPFAWN